VRNIDKTAAVTTIRGKRETPKLVMKRASRVALAATCNAIITVLARTVARMTPG
jgi:hypothetical protein